MDQFADDFTLPRLPSEARKKLRETYHRQHQGRRVLASAQLRPERFFWVVFHDTRHAAYHPEAVPPEPLAQGYAETEMAARTAARAVAGRGALEYPPQYARDFHGHQSRWKQGSHRSDATECQTDTTPTACFTALGLGANATTEDIKQAYRRLSRKIHPDQGGDHEQFIALQRAYEQALALRRK
jgi:hypothetical protein